MARPEQRTLQLVGPRYLVEGQNFYEQPPFERLIYSAAQHTRFTEQQFRIGLSIVCNVFHEPLSIDRRPGGMNRLNVREQIRYLNPEHQLFAGVDLGDEAFNDIKEAYTDTLLRVVDHLEPFPYWSSYVHAKRGPGGYILDGTRVRPRHSLDDIEQTYPFWLQQQLKSQGNRRLWGIQEVIPTADPGEEAARTGQRLEHRRWIIRQMMR